MPSRTVVAKELAEIFKVIAHPDRIRLIEELYQSEFDVSTLAERLGLSSPRVSQHLHQLRLHRIVEERRDGRHHFYSLVVPEIATWIVEAIAFAEVRGMPVAQTNLDSAKRLWSVDNSDTEERSAES
ncbi:MAG: ArsR/SmtB family transcription factor [Woeseiaceae bacterium]